MQDPDLMKKLLTKAANEEDGHILSIVTFDGGARERHHTELLCDAGLMEWRSEQVARVTMEGYGFLAKSEDMDWWSRFTEGLKRTGDILDATRQAAEVVRIVGTMTGG